MTPTKTPSGGIRYTNDALPDQKPTIPDTPRAKANVEKGNHPCAPKEGHPTAADTDKKR